MVITRSNRAYMGSVMSLCRNLVNKFMKQIKHDDRWFQAKCFKKVGKKVCFVVKFCGNAYGAEEAFYFSISTKTEYVYLCDTLAKLVTQTRRNPCISDFHNEMKRKEITVEE